MHSAAPLSPGGVAGRVTSCPDLPSTDLILVLKVQHLGKPFNPGKLG